MAATTAPTTDPGALDRFLEKVEAAEAMPLWTQLKNLNYAEPNSRCVPHVWRFKDIKPLIVEAGSLVPIEFAERRVLQLINPGPKRSGFTTDTLYAGIQSVLPGEVAPAHRHVAHAQRFIIQGSGATTAVEGLEYKMERGDVLLTPSFNWHDHTKRKGEGDDQPMIWLDSLNLPLFQCIPVQFTEEYHDAQYPSKPVDVHPGKMPWRDMQPRLDAVDGPVAEIAYTLPDGSPTGFTMGTSAWRIDAGASTPETKETTSHIFHCISGSGKTIAKDPRTGEATTLTWKFADTWAIPTWWTFQHIAVAGDAPAYLLNVHDRPLLDNLRFYRRRLPSPIGM